MDNASKETLRRIKQNDPTLTELHLSSIWPPNPWDDGVNGGKFVSDVCRDYSTLGECIGCNNHLKQLSVNRSGAIFALDYQDMKSFVGGIKRNSSISKLHLKNYCPSRVHLLRELLKVYEDKNSLEELYVSPSQQFEDDIITTFKACTNIKSIQIHYNGDFTQMFEAIRDNHMLEQLGLRANIGNSGCELLATMLEDQNSSLCRLNLSDRRRDIITNKGITFVASTLSRNNQLRELYIQSILLDEELKNVFSNLLCNTSSINSTYSTNHTLKRLAISGEKVKDSQFAAALYLNGYKNKRNVAIKKILYYHPHIDMEPLFTMDLDGEEKDLKALPYVLSWFDRAAVAVDDEEWIYEDYDVRNNYDRGEYIETFLSEVNETYRVKERKLSAVYQFVQAMPLLFVPASHMKVSE